MHIPTQCLCCFWEKRHCAVLLGLHTALPKQHCIQLGAFACSCPMLYMDSCLFLPEKRKEHLYITWLYVICMFEFAQVGCVCSSCHAWPRTWSWGDDCTIWGCVQLLPHSMCGRAALTAPGTAEISVPSNTRALSPISLEWEQEWSCYCGGYILSKCWG